MRKKILHWLLRPAPYWEFWHPCSGALGGVALGVVVFTVVVVFQYFWK